MIALGWTVRGASVDPPLVVVDLPHCMVLAAPAPVAGTARDRLRLQITCARSLGAFLPLRPSDCVALGEAVARADREGSILKDHLAELTGRVQVTLRADWSPPGRESSNLPEAANGRGWLAARAAVHAAHSAWQAEVATALRAALSARMSGPVMQRSHPSTIQIDALVAASGVEDGLAALAHDLTRLRLSFPVCVSVTGPWPVLAFASLTGHAA